MYPKQRTREYIFKYKVQVRQYEVDRISAFGECDLICSKSRKEMPTASHPVEENEDLINPFSRENVCMSEDTY